MIEETHVQLRLVWGRRFCRGGRATGQARGGHRAARHRHGHHPTRTVGMTSNHLIPTCNPNPSSDRPLPLIPTRGPDLCASTRGPITTLHARTKLVPFLTRIWSFTLSFSHPLNFSPSSFFLSFRCHP